MDSRDSEFSIRLRQTFLVEAEEHIQTITSGLIELEKTPCPEKMKEIIEALFREAHSLKGAARSVNLREIESICQPIETLFSQLKNGKVLCKTGLWDLLHRAMDFLTQLLSSMEESRTTAERACQKELICQLGNFAKTDDLMPIPVVARLASAEELKVQTPITNNNKEASFVQTVRIPVAKLDPLLLQAEEMVQAKMMAQQRVFELREIRNILTSNSDPDLVGLHARVSSVTQSAEQDLRALRHMVDEHLEMMKQVLLLPATFLTEGFPKIVRDLSRDLGKEIDLVISGAEIEIDKRILEELKDPLIHLMRNCIDHGIEKPEERVKRKKSPIGKIAVTFATKDSRQVEISISDDGAGIESRHLPLLFQSGFTTSSIITDISGRGLGLAIVNEKVKKLGGAIAVETVPDSGTTFRLLLPMSLATFRGVLVGDGGHLFIVPTANVERAISVRPEEIKTVENQETIKFAGKILSLIHLKKALGMPEMPEIYHPPVARITLLILVSGDTRMAFQVEEVLDELQVLVKSMGKQLSRVRNVAGATILGNGKVVPVLNVFDLMQSALSSPSIQKNVASEEKAKNAMRILVAEDSITSRTLLKAILQTAGFLVTTAVDGADAFAQVCAGKFDLLVSDVDMPRMSGFELTARIRADKKLNELPVVLVTSLGSIDDRERGIDVGANAYIVKSSFDQSNLLEVIKRLI